MDLRLDRDAASGYKSQAQIARVVTQSWAAKEAYCPSCLSQPLFAEPETTKVIDYTCNDCGEPFQLKSLSHPFGERVLDSAYGPMCEAISTGSVPNYLLLHYDRTAWRVMDLFVVNRTLLTSIAIVPRPPLPSTARRAGWVGCWIDLIGLPVGALVPLVEKGLERSHYDVRDDWRRFSFMASQDTVSRGWLADVLSCIRKTGKQEFSLDDIYAFEPKLSELHPNNSNIQPKVRQQLQLLIRYGAIERVRPGTYRIRTNAGPPSPVQTTLDR